MGKFLVCVCVVLVAATGAYADLVTKSMNFSDTTQGASANIGLSGSATLSGSGTYYSWAGWPTNAWQGVNISFANQTLGLSMTNPGTRASDPDGNGSVTFDMDDLHPGDTLSRLQAGKLNDLNVDIKDGASWTFGLSDLAISGTFNSQTVWFSLYSGSGSINSLAFDMTGSPTGTMTSYTKVPPLSNPGDPNSGMVQAWYSIAPSGNLSASYSSTYHGKVNLPGIGDAYLGSFAPSGSANTGMTLSNGTMKLLELAGPYARDVAVDIHADAGSVSMGFSSSGSWGYNNYSGGTNPYYVISLGYNVGGNVTTGTTHMDLYDTIIDVIPEPTTIAVLGLGGVLFSMARKRRVR